MNTSFPPTATEIPLDANHDRYHGFSNSSRLDDGNVLQYQIPQDVHNQDSRSRKSDIAGEGGDNHGAPQRPAVQELSAGKRMIAACSGSLLTSLLVTPLDVVRVRLQSQTPNSPPWTSNISSSLSSPSSSPSLYTSPAFKGRAATTFPSPSSFAFLSAEQLSRPLSELGVTTCCREVFWVPTTNKVCVAGPSSAAASISSHFENAGSAASSSLELCAAEQASRKNFTGTWEGLVKIARYEGLASLYRGLSPTLLMAIPANVIYFTGYDALRYSSRSPLSGLDDNVAPLVAGSVARMAAASLISPLELFRTRLQATATPSSNHHLAAEAESSITAFRETVDGVRGMVAREGVTSLWRGLTMTLWRDVPFSGIYWWGYEATRQFFKEQRHSRTFEFGAGGGNHHHHYSAARTEADEAATFTDAFLAGSISGAVAAFVTQPFDVGKTRRQVWTNGAAESTAANAAKAAEEASMPRILHGIYEKEGLRGLWRGSVPRLLKISPACAIMISSYEVAKKAMAN